MIELPLSIYDSEKRKLVPFSPLDPEKVTLYTCGPTLYSYAHLGNFRTYLFEDLVRRVLQFWGWKVIHIMNLTDVDDKTIGKATAQNIALAEYIAPYRRAFFEDAAKLHILPAHKTPAATEYIKEMIEVIETLLTKEYAYRAEDGSVYFRIDRVANYGRLFCIPSSRLQKGMRISCDEYEKEEAADFVLWKGYNRARDGEIFWESPFGRGRPGWHLECSTMALTLLGKTIDLHMGGIDNLFPHHENEIAQSEAYTGTLFVRHWMHVQHLLVEGKKMAKSEGNFYLLRDLLKRGHSPFAIRYALLQGHYRSPLNFTFEELGAAEKSIQRICDFLQRMREITEQSSHHALSASPSLEEYHTGFLSALSQDFNLSSALSILFSLIHKSHSRADRGELSSQEASEILQLWEKWNQILAFTPPSSTQKALPSSLLSLVRERASCRKRGEWNRADQLREQLCQEGYLIEDNSQGCLVKSIEDPSFHQLVK